MLSYTFFVEANAYIQGFSQTSLSIGTGVKNITLVKPVRFIRGMTITIDGGSGNTMTAEVISDNGRSTSLKVNVTSVSGSGTISDWVIGGNNTFYFCNNGGFNGKPTDTPTNVFFEGCLHDPGDFSRYIYQDGTTFGRSQVGYGNTSLNNVDGHLDYLLDYGFDGREIIKRRGVSTGAYPNDMDTIFVGTMSGIVDSGSFINLLTRDNQGLVAALPLQATKYLGNNNLVNTALPNVEGLPGDLMGKPKPIWLGYNQEVSPPLVNTSKQTYQLSVLPMTSTGFIVKDKGLSLTLHSTETTLMNLQNATIPGGKYSVYFSNNGEGTFIRTGTNLNNGVITVTGSWDSNAAHNTSAYLADYVLQSYGDISGGFDDTSISDLNSKNDSVIGIYSGTDERTVGDALDEILASVGGYWTTDNDGDYFLGRLEPPKDTPDHVIPDYLLLGGQNKISRVASNDAGGGLPAKRCLLNWGRNYTVLNASDLAGAALSQITFSGLEYRTVYSDINDNTLTKHPLAQELSFDTQLTTESDAQDEVDRRASLYADEYFNVEVSVMSTFAKTFKLGETVELEGVRSFYARNYVINGIINEYKTDSTKLQLLWVNDE